MALSARRPRAQVFAPSLLWLMRRGFARVMDHQTIIDVLRNGEHLYRQAREERSKSLPRRRPEPSHLGKPEEQRAEADAQVFRS